MKRALYCWLRCGADRRPLLGGEANDPSIIQLSNLALGVTELLQNLARMLAEHAEAARLAGRVGVVQHRPVPPVLALRRMLRRHHETDRLRVRVFVQEAPVPGGVRTHAADIRSCEQRLPLLGGALLEQRL